MHPMFTKTLEKKLHKQIRYSSESEDIKQIRCSLLDNISNISYKRWFSDTNISINENQVIFKATCQFAKDWIEDPKSGFMNKIKKVVESNYPEGIEIAIEC